MEDRKDRIIRGGKKERREYDKGRDENEKEQNE